MENPTKNPCQGTKWFFCLDEGTELTGSEKICEFCANKWEYFKIFNDTKHLATDEDHRLYIQTTRATKWRINDTHGIDGIISEPCNINYMPMQPIKVSDVSSDTASKRRQNTGLVFEATRRSENQNSLFLVCRTSSYGLNGRTPKLYMGTLLSAVKTVIRCREKYEKTYPSRKIPTVLQGCFASYGQAGTSIFSFTSKCKNAMNKDYFSLAQLPGAISKAFQEDNIVIAMEHPLHFIAKRKHLLGFLINLENRGVPSEKIFFLIIGLRTMRKNLVLRPTLINGLQLKKAILNDPPLLLTYNSPAVGWLKCADEELKKRKLGPRAGRSCLNLKNL